MKAQFTVSNLKFELDADSAKDLFRQVAEIQEVFEAESECGLCKQEDIRYSYREVDTYKYYELRCGACGAQFQFGQKKQGGALFPKRTKDGEPLANGGWSKWEPRNDEDHRPAARQSTGRPTSTPAKGIPEFASWDDAERSPHWGSPTPIRVEGVLYHIPMGKRAYEVAPAKAQ